MASSPQLPNSELARVREILDSGDQSELRQQLAHLEERLDALETRTDERFDALREWLEADRAASADRNRPLSRVLRALRGVAARVTSTRG